MPRRHPTSATLLTAMCGLTLSLAQAASPGVEIAAELGATFQQRNDVQIPNDAEGTRFSLRDIGGSGPQATARINVNWNINERHGLRFVLAPLSWSETGSFDQLVDFAGEIFDASKPVDASYRFNSWRAGYRYNFYDRDDWQLWVGGTLKVRDAEIELRQGGTRSSDENVGVVPLLYLGAQYRINTRWLIQVDFDGLAGGPGRAFDISTRIGYEPNENWRFSAGYRGLEGGVDGDDVYNFAWFNTGFVGIDYRF